MSTSLWVPKDKAVPISSQRVQWSRPHEHVLCGQTHEWMNGVRDGCRQFIWEAVILGSSVQMN